MGLITLPREPDPREAGWLVPGYNCTELEYKIVVRAFKDLGIIERPRSSNRGIRIDKYMHRAGYKPPQYWCAIWAGIVMVDAGGLVPAYFGGCDEWMPYMSPVPRIGSAALYGKPGDAEHIEIVARIEKDGIWTIGGNKSDRISKSRNGEGVFYGEQTRDDVLGYFHARAA